MNSEKIVTLDLIEGNLESLFGKTKLYACLSKYGYQNLSRYDFVHVNLKGGTSQRIHVGGTKKAPKPSYREN
jgi:hypothetical protein